ncbi:metallophosphoesterase family protein [Aerococcus vaginalis]
MDMPNNQALKLSVLTDCHVLPRHLMADTEAFRKFSKGTTGLTIESEGAFRSAMSLVDRFGANVLLVTGDMTKDGEYASHQWIADQLMKWQTAEADRAVFVIPGNHDINNLEAADFNTATGEPEILPPFTPADFLDVYAPLAQDAMAIEWFKDTAYFENYLEKVNTRFADDRPETVRYYAHGYLSYAARIPKKLTGDGGVTVIGLDSNNYSAEVTKAGDEAKETIGSLSGPQLSWLLDVTAEAHDRGDEVLVLSHHALIPHFLSQENVMPNYIIGNWDESFTDLMARQIVRETDDPRLLDKTSVQVMREADIHFVFTGHTHVNSIAKDGTLYDICTGSTTAFPSVVRHLALDQTREKLQLASETEFLEEVTYITLDGVHETIRDFTSYGEQTLITTDFIIDMIDYFLNIPQYQNLTVRDLLVTYAFDDLDGDIEDAIIALIRKSLIQRDEEWREYDLINSKRFGHHKLRLQWADDITQTVDRKYQGAGVIINLHFGKRQPLRYFIAYDHLKNVIKHLLDNVDRTVLQDQEQMIDWLKEIMDAMLGFELDNDGHTIEDMSNLVYQTYLKGQTPKPQWAQRVIHQLRVDGDVILRDLTDDLKPVVTPIFDKILKGLAYGDEPTHLVERLEDDRLLRKTSTLTLRYFAEVIIGHSLYDTLHHLRLNKFPRLVDKWISNPKLKARRLEMMRQIAEVVDSISNGEQNNFSYHYAEDRDTIISLKN